MIKIVTDGAADMPLGWEDEYKIDIIPLRIRFGEEELLQGRDVNKENFYQIVRERQMPPKTSLPSPAEVVNFYRNIAAKNDEIISIHIGSKLSGTFSVIQTAARDLVGELNVFPLDSGAGSAALGFMCREARLMEQKGKSLEQILAHLRVIRDHITIIFTLENLEFARLSGRINTFQTAISSLLRINPIIMLRDGLLLMGDKVRTRQKAIERVINEVANRVGNQKVRIAVVHAVAPEAAQQLVDKIKISIPSLKEIIVTELSIPVAAHLGPGTVGIVSYPILEDSGE